MMPLVNAPVSNAVDYLENRHCAYPKHPCQLTMAHPLRRKASNFVRLLFSQFCEARLVAPRRNLKPIIIGVLGVVLRGNPFKIANTAIRFDAIDVVDLMGAGWGGANERFRHKFMDDTPPPQVAHGYIHTRVSPRTHADSQKLPLDEHQGGLPIQSLSPSRVKSGDGADATNIGYLVRALKFRARTPLFFHNLPQKSKAILSCMGSVMDGQVINSPRFIGG